MGHNDHLHSESPLSAPRPSLPHKHDPRPSANIPLQPNPRYPTRLTPCSQRDKAGLARSKRFFKEGSGYRTEQGTIPQTVGYTLADSPVGLLAWIYEKLHDWTDNCPWTYDGILTWESAYVFSTAGPAANLRIYYEALHGDQLGRAPTEKYIPHIKLGLAHFPQGLGTYNGAGSVRE